MAFSEGSRVSAKRAIRSNGAHVRRKTPGIVASKRKTVFGNFLYTVAFKKPWTMGKVVTVPGLRERDLRHGWL